MDILGKTLATIGAAWICLLATIVLFDYFQNAINGQANILLAGWSLFRHSAFVPAGDSAGRDRHESLKDCLVSGRGASGNAAARAGAPLIGVLLRGALQ
jgi:hypothetical protein